MDIEDDFYRFVRESCGAPDGGTAGSYRTAINKLCCVLSEQKPSWVISPDIWAVTDPDVIIALSDQIVGEQKKFKKSGTGLFASYQGRGDSYFRKYWCVSALRYFAKYLHARKIEAGYEELLSAAMDSSTDCKKAAKTASTVKLTNQKVFVPEGVNPQSKQGKEIIRSVRVRCNQRVFRSAILNNYQHKCCISGIEIDDVLDAAHICEWSYDLGNALDASNGLCLSATYHRAFDAHLIEFGDNYELLLSKALKDVCTTEVHRRYFEAFEGKKIIMPVAHAPNIKYLAQHRNHFVQG